MPNVTKIHICTYKHICTYMKHICERYASVADSRYVIYIYVNIYVTYNYANIGFA